MGKEREERVRLELRVTELEEEVETQTSHMTSVKWVWLKHLYSYYKNSTYIINTTTCKRTLLCDFG